jgi:hypothetical protein
MVRNLGSDKRRRAGTVTRNLDGALCKITTYFLPILHVKCASTKNLIRGAVCIGLLRNLGCCTTHKEDHALVIHCAPSGAYYRLLQSTQLLDFSFQWLQYRKGECRFFKWMILYVYKGWIYNHIKVILRPLLFNAFHLIIFINKKNNAYICLACPK